MIIFNNDDEKKDTIISENSSEDIQAAPDQHGESVQVPSCDTDDENTPNEKIDALVKEEFLKEHNAKFHKGNLRSGMHLDFDGSIIILGDVNPGAQVKATGNILVLGTLKGMAHAGSSGEKEAYVFALNMNPVQLRIADIITRFPESGRNKNDIIPEYAYIEDGKVYVSTFE